ncbi:MAG: calcium-binding protein [Pseudomonadota bacterium]
MASFVVTTDTQSGQGLLSGEFGFVAANGSIMAPVGSAVVLNGTASLVSYGALAASTASALVLNAAGSTSVTITDTGSVVTSGIDLAAISGSFSGPFALHLSGMVSGGQGVNLTAASAFSTINIGNDGTLQGLGFAAGHAIALTLTQGSNAVISNTGMISTAGTGATIKVDSQWGGVTLTNTGDIVNASTSQAAIDVTGSLALRNSGRIEGGVSVKDGAADIYNAGTLHGDIKLSGYADTVRISGVVMGDVILGDGSNVFWQTGGRVMNTVYGGFGDDIYHVDRSDTAISDTTGGADVVYASASFRLSAGLEKLVLLGPVGLVGTGNAGTNVILGDTGDDILWGLGGNDDLNAGEGNNRLMGGAGNDTLRSGEGSDWLDGGPGTDTVYVSYGNDTLWGGAGRDMLRFDTVSGLAGVTANLTTSKASFMDQDEMLTVFGFEDILGTPYADALTGNALANSFMGGGGADMLSGGEGADTLTGGTQADVLYGGKGADVFVFSAAADSMMTARDTIKDFEKGLDVIYFAPIDAVLGGLDNAFRFIGTQAFSASGAEVRYQRVEASGTTLIEVRLGGSVKDDLQIVLTGLFDLTAASFVL